MSSSIQARLDPASQKALTRLVRQLGWSPSRIVREGLLVLAACHLRKGKQGEGRRQIIGQGKFASGIPDLGSNKAHLKDFGR